MLDSFTFISGNYRFPSKAYVDLNNMIVSDINRPISFARQPHNGTEYTPDDPDDARG